MSASRVLLEVRLHKSGLAHGWSSGEGAGVLLSPGERKHGLYRCHCPIPDGHQLLEIAVLSVAVFFPSGLFFSVSGWLLYLAAASANLSYHLLLCTPSLTALLWGRWYNSHAFSQESP